MACVGRDSCIDHYKIDIDLQALTRNLAGEKGRGETGRYRRQGPLSEIARQLNGVTSHKPILGPYYSISKR